MFIPNNKIIQCSKCKSKKHEYVEQGNIKFVRRLTCGHEGNKREIYPTCTDTSAHPFYIKQNENRTEEF